MIIYNHDTLFSSFGIPENGFPANNLCRRRNFTHTANAKIPTFYLLSRGNGKRQPANVENGGKIMATWSLSPFRFSRKRDGPGGFDTSENSSSILISKLL